jgi:hypothetical protein
MASFYSNTNNLQNAKLVPDYSVQKNESERAIIFHGSERRRWCLK